MATISGKWQWNTSPSGGELTSGSSTLGYTRTTTTFTSNGTTYYTMMVAPTGSGSDITISYSDGTMYSTPDGWVDSNYMTVDFGSSGVSMDDDFYSYFTENATKLGAKRLSGRWKWNSTPSAYNSLGVLAADVSFVSYESTYSGIYVTVNNVYTKDMAITYSDTEVYSSDNGWIVEEYRVVDFGSDGVEVSDDYYEYFTSNASLETYTLYTVEYHVRTQLNGSTEYGEYSKVTTQTYREGASITAPYITPEQGYADIKWDDLPYVMPSKNLVIYGDRALYPFTLTFKVDGSAVKTDDVLYTFPIEYPEDPTKDGYKFIGWDSDTVTMPNTNLVINAVFEALPKLEAPFIYTEETIKLATPSIYIEEILPKLSTPSIRLEAEIAENERDIYYHDRDQYNNNGALAYTNWSWTAVEGCVPGEVIPLKTTGAREGYTPTGWALADGSPVPEIMPDEDLHIYLTWNLNTYKATFLIEGEVYDEYEGLYTFPIEYPEDPSKEGYRFTGWTPGMVNMPANDVAFTPVFTNQLLPPTIYFEVVEEGSDTHYIISFETLSEIGDSIRAKIKSVDKIPVVELAKKIDIIPELKYSEVQNVAKGVTVMIEYR